MRAMTVVVIGAGLGGLTGRAILALRRTQGSRHLRSITVGVPVELQVRRLFIEARCHEPRPRTIPRSKTRALNRAGVIDGRQMDFRPARCTRRAAVQLGRAVCDAGPFRGGAGAPCHTCSLRPPRRNPSTAGRWSRIAPPWVSSRKAATLQKSGHCAVRAFQYCCGDPRLAACRCRKSLDRPSSAARKRSNPRWPANLSYFLTTTRRRCGGSISRWRRKLPVEWRTLVHGGSQRLSHRARPRRHGLPARCTACAAASAACLVRRPHQHRASP